jgi:hypothetical protein
MTKTRSILYRTTSVFYSTVTNNEQRISCDWAGLNSESEPYVTTDGSVGLGIKHPSGAYDRIFITVRQLRVCWCEALSLMRGRVCHLQLLLVLASAVILGSESHETRDHSLLSQIRDFAFRRLLRLAGSRWRYSTPPLHTGWTELWVWVGVWVWVTLRLTICQYVCLGVEPRPGLMTRY